MLLLIAIKDFILSLLVIPFILIFLFFSNRTKWVFLKTLYNIADKLEKYEGNNSGGSE
jgi:hypothetical protein